MAFQEIAQLNQIPKNKIHVVETRYNSIGILHNDSGIYAFENACTHDGGGMEDGELKDCILVCPRHFAEFDLKTGKVLCLPATEDLTVYPIQIKGESVWVDLGEES